MALGLPEQSAAWLLAWGLAWAPVSEAQRARGARLMPTSRGQLILMS
jgi:hypothetical protein